MSPREPLKKKIDPRSRLNVKLSDVCVQWNEAERILEKTENKKKTFNPCSPLNINTLMRARDLTERILKKRLRFHYDGPKIVSRGCLLRQELTRKKKKTNGNKLELFLLALWCAKKNFPRLSAALETVQEEGENMLGGDIIFCTKKKFPPRKKNQNLGNPCTIVGS